MKIKKAGTTGTRRKKIVRGRAKSFLCYVNLYKAHMRGRCINMATTKFETSRRHVIDVTFDP